MNKVKMTFKEFNEKQDQKEVVLMEKDVCIYNRKRYAIRAIQSESNVILTELPPKPIKEEE